MKLYFGLRFMNVCMCVCVIVSACEYIWLLRVSYFNLRGRFWFCFLKIKINYQAYSGLQPDYLFFIYFVAFHRISIFLQLLKSAMRTIYGPIAIYNVTIPAQVHHPEAYIYCLTKFICNISNINCIYVRYIRPSGSLILPL